MRTLVAKSRHLAPTEACTVHVTFRRIACVGCVIHARACAGAGEAGKTAAERRTGPFVGDGNADQRRLARVAVRLAVAAARGLVVIDTGFGRRPTDSFRFDSGTSIRCRGSAVLAVRAYESVRPLALMAHDVVALRDKRLRADFTGWLYVGAASATGSD